MRAFILLANIGFIVLAIYLGSWTGLLIAACVCFTVAAAFFVFSTDTKESGESKDMRKAMGRNTTFLAGLFESNKR